MYSLEQTVATFIGGHTDGTRNMEAMIRQIAQVAAHALGVRVRAVAELNLQAGRTMRRRARLLEKPARQRAARQLELPLQQCSSGETHG